MPLSALDPKPALVVVDLQKGLSNAPAIHPLEEIVQRAAELAKAFRSRALPVVLVNVAGGAPGRTDANRPAFTPSPEWVEIIDTLDPQPTDHRITKLTWGAFHRTGLDTYLQEQGVTQVVLAGVSTSVGVETTARAAYEHGYHVVLATDAMTDTNPEAHENSVERIFPRLGETTTTAELLKLLEETT